MMQPPQTMIGGNGGLALTELPFLVPPLAPPVPPARSRYTPAEIVKMVDQHEIDIQPLRDRMEKDYELYRLTEHVNTDPKTGEVLQGYASYTSSDPRAFANKIMSWLANAKILIRVEHINDRGHSKEIDNLKERFAIGVMKAANERLVRLVQPMLQGTDAFYITVRGGAIGGRCLLRKNQEGRTITDVTPWDPMHTHYGVDDEGLAWVCYKIKKTRQQIQNEYGVVLPQSQMLGTADEKMTAGSTDAELEGLDIYDFYDKEINTVVMANEEVLKKPTRHGSPRVAATMVLVGYMPLIQPLMTGGVIADIGESVYESIRNTTDKYNNIMSVVLELVSRSRKPPVAVKSRDGRKTLGEDPYVEGTTVSLAEGESIEPLKLLEMAKDTGAFLAILSSEIQRGSLPHTIYGELAFQLSGYAINTLRQGIESILATRLSALEQITLQRVNLLHDQYMTGAFDAIEVSGMEQGRKYFSQTITPDQLRGACDYHVTVVSQLPQDDMSKYTMAQIARTGPVPLFSDAWIKDNILGIQDAEQSDNQVKAQQAQRALPEAGLYDLMRAAEDQGEHEIASFYYQKLISLIAAQMGILPPGGQIPNPNGNPPREAVGNRPEVLPQAALGTSPAPATSNQGAANIAPGTPRFTP